MNKNTEKKLNDTVTALWENEKFGEGALLSAEIDAKAYDVLQNVGIGQKFLIKRVERNGKTTFFMEVLPKFEKRAAPTKGGSRKQAAASDEV